MPEIDIQHLRNRPPNPDEVAAIRAAPIEYLPYFVEWGRPAWANMTRQMLEEEVGLDWFAGKTVMDLGSRYGKMGTLFGLLGANVVGLDYNPEFQTLAEEEAKRFGVEDNVEFFTIDATEFFVTTGRKFDMIFTKSVLTIIPTPLDEIVPTIVDGLAPNGRFVGVENGKGSFLYHFMRRFGPKSNANWRKWTYFDKALVQFMRGHFSEFRVRYLPFPPVYGMIGEGKAK